MATGRAFLAANLLLLASLAAVLARERGRQEWRGFQREYRRLELGRGRGPVAGYGIRQLTSPELGRSDRCVSCHLGLDPLLNPTLTTPYERHPYKARDVPEHRWHPPQRFACTPCHLGQGAATTSEAAHGRVPHWKEPLLTGEHLRASCARCHGDFRAQRGAEFARAAQAREPIARLACVRCHCLTLWRAGGPSAPPAWAHDRVE